MKTEAIACNLTEAARSFSRISLTLSPEAQLYGKYNLIVRKASVFGSQLEYVPTERLYEQPETSFERP